jgi:hypothetical protein
MGWEWFVRSMKLSDARLCEASAVNTADGVMGGGIWAYNNTSSLPDASTHARALTK